MEHRIICTVPEQQIPQILAPYEKIIKNLRLWMSFDKMINNVPMERVSIGMYKNPLDDVGDSIIEELQKRGYCKKLNNIINIPTNRI